MPNHGNSALIDLLALEQGNDGGVQDDKIAAVCRMVGIKIDWSYAPKDEIHDRAIVTDMGWKIVLGWGLDIFQRTGNHSQFSSAGRMQEQRPIQTPPEPPVGVPGVV